MIKIGETLRCKAKIFQVIHKVCIANSSILQVTITFAGEYLLLLANVKQSNNISSSLNTCSILHSSHIVPQLIKMYNLISSPKIGMNVII